VLQSAVLNLTKPRSRAVRLFVDWFRGNNRVSQYSIIGGEARKMLDDRDDLVALRATGDSDMLSSLVQDHWPLQVIIQLEVHLSALRRARLKSMSFCVQGTQRERVRGSTRYFLHKNVARTVALISAAIAVLELVGAILGLYFVSDSGTRLGMISAFTILFALSLRFLTNARRGEIFGATAAYAAVLVVFVSSNLSNSS
jgi:hypothetical protein